ncbi:hypothetical protein BaRGS_00020466 [Batillaria attramentaria]|uniref:Uncharacterized protein n=1 Tax=Batillaria attramentaria TaxID=370345 RepID=A0ABD0KN02_9CAEN
MGGDFPESFVPVKRRRTPRLNASWATQKETEKTMVGAAGSLLFTVQLMRRRTGVAATPVRDGVLQEHKSSCAPICPGRHMVHRSCHTCT